MRPQSLLYLAVFLLVLIVLTFLKINENPDFIRTILTVSTFLFGIFIAFTISDRQNRIDKIRENDSNERGLLTSLFQLSALFGKGVQKRISNLIDKYLMATLDYTIWDYCKTEKRFTELVNGSSSIKSKAKQYGLQPLLSILIELGKARKQTIGLIDDRLSFFEWSVIILFSGIIMVSILISNTGTMLSTILSTSLIFSIILLISFLYSLDKLSWKEETRIFEPYQSAFESIGKLRYYPKDVIEKGRVTKYKGKHYRVAVYTKPYPDMRGKKIKIVKK